MSASAVVNRGGVQGVTLTLTPQQAVVLSDLLSTVDQNDYAGARAGEILLALEDADVPPLDGIGIYRPYPDRYESSFAAQRELVEKAVEGWK